MVGLLLNWVGINMCVAGPLIHMAHRNRVIRNRDQNVKALQKEYTQKKFTFQDRISRHLKEISIIMSQCGLSKKWQADYFSMRAQRAFKEGFYLIGGFYMEYAKKMKYDLDPRNAKNKID